MVYVVTYMTRNNRTNFKANFFNGMARHTTKSDAEYTLRKCIESHPDAEVMIFTNMKAADKWLIDTNETERSD